jgi:hypothetical protein
VRGSLLEERNFDQIAYFSHVLPEAVLTVSLLQQKLVEQLVRLHLDRADKFTQFSSLFFTGIGVILRNVPYSK